MNWQELNLRDRAQLIRLGVASGLRDLKSIKYNYNKFDDGGDLKTWKKLLGDYWQQDLDKDDYDYDRYFNDNPQEAWIQLNHILSGGKGHFPDGGKSGIYKKLSHPTYPDRGVNSWNKEETTFYPSDRQMEDSDRILDYLGIDHAYNNGGTKVSYEGGQVLPTLYVTPSYSYTDMRKNKLGTGYVYSDRPSNFSGGGTIKNEDIQSVETPIEHLVIPQSTEKRHQEAIDWTANWLNNRRAQLANNANNMSNSIGYNHYDLHKMFVGPLALGRRIKERINGHNPDRINVNRDIYRRFNNMATATYAGVPTNSLSRGEYNLNSHTVRYYPERTSAPSTIMHELNHAARSRAQEDAIHKIIFGDKKYSLTKGNGVLTPKWDAYIGADNLDEYLLNYYTKPGEVHSYLMQYRYNNNMDPKFKVDKSYLDSHREQLESGNLDMFSDDVLLRLFNEVAQNGTNIENLYSTNYAALGGNLYGKAGKIDTKEDDVYDGVLDTITVTPNGSYRGNYSPQFGQYSDRSNDYIPISYYDNQGESSKIAKQAAESKRYQQLASIVSDIHNGQEKFAKEFGTRWYGAALAPLLGGTGAASIIESMPAWAQLGAGIVGTPLGIYNGYETVKEAVKNPDVGTIFDATSSLVDAAAMASSFYGGAEGAKELVYNASYPYVQRGKGMVRRFKNLREAQSLPDVPRIRERLEVLRNTPGLKYNNMVGGYTYGGRPIGQVVDAAPMQIEGVPYDRMLRTAEGTYVGVGQYGNELHENPTMYFLQNTSKSDDAQLFKVSHLDPGSHIGRNVIRNSPPGTPFSPDSKALSIQGLKDASIKDKFKYVLLGPQKTNDTSYSTDILRSFAAAKGRGIGTVVDSADTNIGSINTFGRSWNREFKDWRNHLPAPDLDGEIHFKDFTLGQIQWWNSNVAPVYGNYIDPITRTSPMQMLITNGTNYTPVEYTSKSFTF